MHILNLIAVVIAMTLTAISANADCTLRNVERQELDALRSHLQKHHGKELENIKMSRSVYVNDSDKSGNHVLVQFKPHREEGRRIYFQEARCLRPDNSSSWSCKIEKGARYVHPDIGPVESYVLKRIDNRMVDSAITLARKLAGETGLGYSTDDLTHVARLHASHRAGGKFFVDIERAGQQKSLVLLMCDPNHARKAIESTGISHKNAKFMCNNTDGISPFFSTNYGNVDPNDIPVSKPSTFTLVHFSDGYVAFREIRRIAENKVTMQVVSSTDERFDEILTTKATFEFDGRTRTHRLYSKRGFTLKMPRPGLVKLPADRYTVAVAMSSWRTIEDINPLDSDLQWVYMTKKRSLDPWYETDKPAFHLLSVTSKSAPVTESCVTQQ